MPGIPLVLRLNIIEIAHLKNFTIGFRWLQGLQHLATRFAKEKLVPHFLVFFGQLVSHLLFHHGDLLSPDLVLLGFHIALDNTGETRQIKAFIAVHLTQGLEKLEVQRMERVHSNLQPETN